MSKTVNLDDEMCARLHTQDNRITAHPLFVVYQKRRIYGIDPRWSDDKIAWLDRDENEEVSAEEAAKQEETYRGAGIQAGYTRTGFVDFDDFVTACFTEQAAKDYIEANAHNLNKPHVFANSLYRNKEMIAIRDAMMAPIDPDAPTVEQLKAQNAELQAIVDDRFGDAAKLRLLSAGPDPDGKFSINMASSVVPLIAAHLAETFKAMGGENFVEIEVNHDELGPFTFSMQRRKGKMPSQVAAEARAALERDRSAVAEGVTALKKAIASRAWLREAGRGSYAYNDTRYQAEFGEALDEIKTAMAPLASIAADWSGCPLSPEAIAAARAPVPTAEGPYWLVWSNEHSAWWRAGCAGYCSVIEGAGRYTLKDALDCCDTRSKRPDRRPDEIVQPSPELVAALKGAA